MWGCTSIQDRTAPVAYLSSPRMWGCTLSQTDYLFIVIFPTHVGVYLQHEKSCWVFIYLPHARGGVPSEHPLEYDLFVSSPRMWECAGMSDSLQSTIAIFPTHVGFESERVLFLCTHILRHN